MIRPPMFRVVEAEERTTLELGWLTVSAMQPPEDRPAREGQGWGGMRSNPAPPPIPPPPSATVPPSVPVEPAVPAGRLPQATWWWWEAVVVYLVAQVVAAVPLVMLQAAGLIDVSANNGPSYLAALIAGELAFAGSVIFWVRVVRSTPIAVLGLPVEPMRDLATGIPTGVGLYVLAFVVGVVVAWVYQQVTGSSPPSPNQVPEAVTGGWLLLTGIGVVFLAPFGEELLFRGMLFRGFRRRMSVWPAAVCSAALFALGHLQGWSFFVLLPPLFVVGIGLALVYERRQSLLASMSAHATFNLIGFLFIFTSRR